MGVDGSSETDIAADPPMEMRGAWSSTVAFVRYHGAGTPVPRSAVTRPQEPGLSAASRSRRLIQSLTLLLLRSTPQTGRGLRRQLELAGLRPDPGELYRMLHRLKREGHVVCVAAVAEGGGSPERRAYRLTAVGVEQLQGESEALERLWKLLVSVTSQHGESEADGAAAFDGKLGTKPVDAPASALVELHVSDRDAAILAARKRGDTLQEIGTRFGLTRERVRQILARSSAAGARASKIARAERELAGADVGHEEVLALFRAGLGLKAIAGRLGLSQGCIGWLIERHATPADRAARRLAQRLPAQRRGPRGHSDEDLIGAMKQVVKDADRVPLSREYEAIAQASGLPSLSTIQNRFGGWSAALRAAGLMPLRDDGRPSRRRWTAEACVEAVRSLTTELGALPTLREYERLAGGRSGLPSATTVRNRLGSWSRLALMLEAEGSAPRRRGGDG